MNTLQIGKWACAVVLTTAVLAGGCANRCSDGTCDIKPPERVSSSKAICPTPCDVPRPVAASACISLPEKTVRTVESCRRVPIERTGFKTKIEYKTVKDTCQKKINVCNPCSNRRETRTLDFECEKQVAVRKQIPYTFTDYRNERYTEKVPGTTCRLRTVRGWRLPSQRNLLFVKAEDLREIRAAYNANRSNACGSIRNEDRVVVWNRREVGNDWKERRIPGKLQTNECGDAVRQRVVIERYRTVNTVSERLPVKALVVGRTALADARVLVNKGLLSQTAYNAKGQWSRRLATRSLRQRSVRPRQQKRRYSETDRMASINQRW